jgi:hypothetical protein
MDGFAGVTAMLTIGFVTVSVAVPEIVPNVAEIVVVPGATATANPAGLMAATVGADDAQVTVEVMFWVVPSAYLPVAVNCCWATGASVTVGGVTAIETSGFATVSVVLPTTAPEAAVMLLVPTATAVARPDVLMVATEEVTVIQLALAVRFFVVPSLYVPVAVNCCVAPTLIDGLEG